MSVARSRILDLMKVQCRIFSMTFNPERTRTGNKILRQRLKGPSVAAYYPRRVATVKDLRALYPDLDTWDEDEDDRLEHVALMKLRGKGAPKKKRSGDGELMEVYKALTVAKLKMQNRKRSSASERSQSRQKHLEPSHAIHRTQFYPN
ncbi:MAG: hypothetical protein LQ349_007119 [Xanthoria aureola]|nr:MAG: hypothetical protein LQ349_007119 [Xanthoria aureola]